MRNCEGPLVPSGPQSTSMRAKRYGLGTACRSFCESTQVDECMQKCAETESCGAAPLYEINIMLSHFQNKDYGKTCDSSAVPLMPRPPLPPASYEMCYMMFKLKLRSQAACDNMVDPTLRGILQSSVAKWNTDLYVANVTTLDPAVVQSVIDGISQKKYKYTTVTTHLVLKDQDLNDYNVTGLVKWGFWCRCLRCGPLAEASLSALRRWETL
uniref:Uncharacterized protein n=1 Tax=Alexandrium monilatum TaxID=311494 RepID=A0A7S4UDV1_9DINO|mmetsp:Transcript_27375/g.86604  ORF Transcript_27375/g.86604 Transcript_27375/m.86604 type:complete len:212 (+) Transcript_27375:91-726(+)